MPKERGLQARGIHPRTPRTSRQRPVSCQFCRSRKLRCSRTLPCSNCLSRGIACRLDPATDPVAPAVVAAATPAPSTASDRDAVQADMLERLHRLEQLVTQQQATQSRVENAPSEGPAEDLLIVPRVPPPATPSPSDKRPDSSPRLQHLSDDVAWLERVSIGQSSHDRTFPDTIVFKIGPIHDLPKAPSYISQLTPGAEPTRCVWLPQYQEAKILQGKYINNVSYIHHVVHLPSLPAFIDKIYVRLTAQDRVEPGHLMLLLAILASATYTWTDHDQDCGHKPFSSSAEANSQAPFWVRATQDVFDAAQRSTCLSLELLQGVIILSFVVCNIEGISLRYRSLIYSALLIGRELGLHRCDHPSNTGTADTVRAEIGRRVWWYLVATDWFLAARSSGPTEGIYQSNPHHMVVNKPRNINDEDLSDGANIVEKPISHPTDMSYSLQRIRLAELTRSIVDRNHLLGRHGWGHGDIMAIDGELERFMADIPPFFNLETDEPNHDRSPRAHGIIIQAYMLNSLVHTHRCKLHLPHLARGRQPSSDTDPDPAHARSRDACLDAARLIIRTETRLEREDHPFVPTRLRFPGILYGVFVATIALLADACAGGSASSIGVGVSGGSEVADAIRILGDAAAVGRSRTAADLLESLTLVLRKHGLPLPPGLRRRGPLPRSPGGSDEVDGGNDAAAAARLRDDRGDGAVDMAGRSPGGNERMAYSDELAQILEGWADLEGFQWDGIFSGIDSSSFF